MPFAAAWMDASDRRKAEMSCAERREPLRYATCVGWSAPDSALRGAQRRRLDETACATNLRLVLEILEPNKKFLLLSYVDGRECGAKESCTLSPIRGYTNCEMGFNTQW